MANCYVALGGNRGDIFATLEDTLSVLDRVSGLRVDAVSPVYETAPVGPSTESAFFNAASRLECDLAPMDLLRELQTAEDRAGRRRETRWAARSLDLDLLLYGEAVLSEPELTVPHPHLWYRRFVLDPLSDIAADVRHPVFNEAVGTLREHLRRRPLTIAMVGGTAGERDQISEHVDQEYAAVVVMRDIENGGEPAAITLDLSTPGDPPGLGEVPQRCVSLRALPGSTFEAAASVLTAALDEPARHKRPLRKMP